MIYLYIVLVLKIISVSVLIPVIEMSLTVRWVHRHTPPGRIGVTRRLLNNKLCGRPPQYAPAPCKLIVDHLTLKMVSVPILVFLSRFLFHLGLMYATWT